MAVQDKFPKVPGDILFDTEVNRFAGGGRFINAGSGGFIPSGAGRPDAGSFVMVGNTISNPGVLDIHYSTKRVGANSSVDLACTISGIGGNSVVTLGSLLPDANMKGKISFLIGSPFPGKGDAWGVGTVSNVKGASVRFAGVVADNVDVTGSLVVLFGVRYYANGSSMVSWLANSEGNGL